MEKQQKTLNVNPSGETVKPVIRWNQDRTDLVDTGEKIDLVEEYKARAKGTTVYELIAACGGIENLETIIPQPEGNTVDLSGIPEFEHTLNELATKVVNETLQKHQQQQQQEVDDVNALKARIAELEKQVNGGVK